MSAKVKRDSLVRLNRALEGELKFDEVSKLIYATDASSYREIPIAATKPSSFRCCSNQHIINLS